MSQVSQDENTSMGIFVNQALRGYCTPDQFCDCLYAFFSTITTHWWQVRYVGNISRNLITALKFYKLKWLLIDLWLKTWKILIFTHFYRNCATLVSTEGKLWFLSSFEHFWPDPQDTLSKVALFFKKMHKVFKNKAQGCSTPLKKTINVVVVKL